MEEATRLKDWLLLHIDHYRTIESLEERIELLRHKMIGVNSPQITGMPKGSPVGDGSIVNYLSLKMAYEEKLEAARKRVKIENELIVEMTKDVAVDHGREVIIRRYVQFQEWNEIASSVWTDTVDMKTKLSRAYRIHSAAIYQIAAGDIFKGMGI